MLNNRAVGEIKIISKYCVSITRCNRMAGIFFITEVFSRIRGVSEEKTSRISKKLTLLRWKMEVRGVLEKSGVFLINTFEIQKFRGVWKSKVSDHSHIRYFLLILERLKYKPCWAPRQLSDKCVWIAHFKSVRGSLFSNASVPISVYAVSPATR